MACILVLGCEAELGARLRDELARHGAEIVVADDPPAAASALSGRRVDGVIAALEVASARGPTSGLGLLLSARAQHPVARRVLVVERRGPIIDAAIEAGIADRVLSGPPSASRLGALAEWLTDLASHAPRRDPS